MPFDSAIRDFLNQQRFAVLGTINADGTPQLTVMWYLLRGDVIVMNTTLDRVKGKNLRRDPRISICVDDDYRYVTIAGIAQLRDDQAIAQADIRELAILNHGPEAGARQADEVFARQQRVSIYLPTSRVIAKMS